MSTGALEGIRQEARARTQAADASHDWSHIERVAALCRSLGKDEGAEERILLAAAYMHDLVNVPKNHPDRASASVASAKEAAGILRRHGYDSDEIGRVMLAIEEHSFSRGLDCTSIESRVLQDADRLDALGAIGVLRTTTCGALMRAAYDDPSDPFARNRALDDRRYTLDHFPVKLLRLAERFNTASGRREADRRTRFMEDFLGQLANEIGSEGNDDGTLWPQYLPRSASTDSQP
jgi:uncharacterized protein